ncbi:NfeD family protein [Oculatella sp. LEGE 06141]|uniref:NfeD family protein n=1 Tax=Oculatella sp. LEGE 06141 TaxID=1828648 RepID=UPI00188003EA|nr:NfeD family protein [Oculatella sp. LEGE 06141]MBE9177382.1 NfeD family protein [Oculatella sp. LEGE 06141]
MLSPWLIWLIAGVILCVMEFALPTAFIEFTMGVSAILVALLVWVLPQMSFGLQVVFWLVLSVGLTIASRRFVPQVKSRLLEDATEAKTLTEILPGENGRVLYEGNSWQARCGDEAVAIAPNQKVYVVERQGNTLIVMPASSIQAHF